MASEESKLQVSEQGGVSVVVLGEEKILDDLSISRIGSELREVIGDSANPRIVLDFRNVIYMSSSALGMLITLHKRIRQADGQLRLCDIQPSISEVFKITRLDEIFAIDPDRAKARAAMRK